MKVSGDHYVGEWNLAKMGKGKYYWKNGDVYEGNLLNDCIQGKGFYVWENGDKV